MMRLTRRNLVVVFVSASALLVAGSAFAIPKRPQGPIIERSDIATELVAPDQLTFETAAPFDKAVLTISGPKDIKIRKEYESGEPIALSATDLTDGRYRYLLRVSPKIDRGGVKQGVFFIENGAIVSRKSKREQLADIRGGLNMSRRKKVEEAVAKLGSRPERRPGAKSGGLRPSSDEPRVGPSLGGMPPYPPYPGGLFGGYVGILGYGPLLYFYENPYGPPGPAGYYPPIGMTGFMMQYYGINYRFSQYANYDYAYYNVNLGVYNINVGYGNYNYGFSNYDYGIFNIRYAGFVNADIGYRNYFLALYGSNISYAYGVDYGYGFYGGFNLIIGAGYDLYDYSLEYQSLYVGPTGVGVGTNSPLAQFHVYGYGDAQVFVDETQAGEHILFGIRNPGKTRFLVNNTTAGSWTFDVDNAARFNISKLGTGVNEFLMEPDGDGFFLGNVYAKGVKLTSSRETKEAIEALSSTELLAKLMEVPVSEWQFKQDSSETRHIGPMAEDFQKVFGLGTGQHLSVTDVQGVAVAAIQGLNTKLTSLETENAVLRSELAEIRAMVQSLAKSQ